MLGGENWMDRWGRGVEWRNDHNGVMLIGTSFDDGRLVLEKAFPRVGECMVPYP